MKITDLLSEKTIALNVKASSKEDVIKQAVKLISASGKISDVEVYQKGVFKREEESTTGIGEGIAIPHCKNDVVTGPALAGMVIPEGVDYDSLDGEKVQLLFLIAAPNSEDNVHLEVLARLSKMLMDEDFKNKLVAAKSKKEFLKVIDDAEAEKVEEVKEEASGYPQLLGITGCPTGIAHTYMAEEALVNKAKEMNYTMKIETRGSGGAKNVLTAEEIEHCLGVVVAADIGVDLTPFDGKRVVVGSTSQGISKPQELIEQALNPNTPVYQATGEKKAKAPTSGKKESVGHEIYKHLMSGVSHMLPFVIGGGILIALAFLIDTFAGNAGLADFGSHNGVAAWFKNLGGYAFGFMVWVLAGFIGYSIADRPGLAVGMVGGFIATTSTFNIQYVIEGVDKGSNAGFLGGIAAGFLAGYIVLGLGKLFAKLPKSLDALKPMLIYPVLGTLCIGAAMFLICTPLIYVNVAFNELLTTMGQNPALLVVTCALLATMMATDMGGPINKAAYVFAAGSLATQKPEAYIMMAAVMAGGMVPPLGIALSANLFPQKYSKKQRGDAMVNYVMGASFITEGAIPFAAADPWRVIVSCAGGSLVAGLLSGLFQCQLLAPHGGIFVLGTIRPEWYTIVLYLLAIIIGSAITAILLGILKKDHPNPELGKWQGLRLRKNAKVAETIEEE